MSDTHPYMEHKLEILQRLFQRFKSWRLRDDEDGPDLGNAPRDYRAQVSEIGRKRARAKSGGSGSEDEDPDTKSTMAKKPRRSRDSHNLHLACPFYKKSPLKYSSCHCLTLSRIGDVKQHLGRAHRLPVYCARCKAIFPNETDCDSHAAQQPPCGIRTDIRHKGITADINKQLKQCVSWTAPEEQQWFSIFDILFPGHQPRPQNAYINTDLVAETEGFQTFEQIEGPAILLGVLRERGTIGHIDDQDHDLGVFRRNILAEGFSLISQRFIECRRFLHTAGATARAEAVGDTTASVVEDINYGKNAS